MFLIIAAGCARAELTDVRERLASESEVVVKEHRLKVSQLHPSRINIEACPYIGPSALWGVNSILSSIFPSPPSPSVSRVFFCSIFVHALTLSGQTTFPCATNYHCPPLLQSPDDPVLRSWRIIMHRPG
jgi:hypothetical protein